MASPFQISLQSLAGLQKLVEVNPGTRVEELCKLVKKANVEFCDIKLLAGSQLLQGDTVEELGLYPGAVLQVVLSWDLAKAASAVKMYFECVKDLAHGSGLVHGDPNQLRKKSQRAMRLFSKIEDLPAGICEKLLSIITGIIFDVKFVHNQPFLAMMDGRTWEHGIVFFQNVGVASGVLKKGEVAEDLVALCQTVGHLCNNPTAYAAQLIRAWRDCAESISYDAWMGGPWRINERVRSESHSGLYFASLFTMIVLSEIDLRDANALPMCHMENLVDEFVLLQAHYVENGGIPSRKRLLRISASMELEPAMYKLIGKFGNLETWQDLTTVAEVRRAFMEQGSGYAKVHACELLMHLEDAALATMGSRFAAPGEEAEEEAEAQAEEEVEEEEEEAEEAEAEVEAEAEAEEAEEDEEGGSPALILIGGGEGGGGVAPHPMCDNNHSVRDSGTAKYHLRCEVDAKFEANKADNLASQSTERAGVDAMHVTDVALNDALEMSEKEAQQLEQADVVEAIMRSNTEARNADGVQIVRLTSHSPQIKSHILDSAVLQACFDRVRSAGCEVNPSWANGALLLVPMSAEQLVESQIQLKAHNIVLLSADIAVVQEALARLPNRKRPAVKPECQADRVHDSSISSTMDAFRGANQSNLVTTTNHSNMPEHPNHVELVEIEIVVEHTFVHVPLRHLEISESSTVANSAPPIGCIQKHPNPRRWSKK